MPDTTTLDTTKTSKLKNLIKNGGGSVEWSDIDFDIRQNLRDEYGDLSELDSLEDGLIQAIIGYIEGDKFFPVDGFRRLSWIKQRLEEGLTIPKIRVTIKQATSTPIGRLTLILNSATAKSLTLVEQGKGYQKLRDECGLNLLEISSIAHKTSAHISNCLGLVDDTNPEVIEMIEAGEVSASTVIKLNQTLGSNEAASLITEAVEVAKESGKDKATAATIEKVKASRKSKDPNYQATDINPLSTAELVEAGTDVTAIHSKVEDEKLDRETIIISLESMNWDHFSTGDLRKIFNLASN